MITTSSAFASSLAATNFAPLVNFVNGNALFLLGGGIAFAVNKLAHQIFSVQKNSHASKAISAVAFLAGAAASFSVAPHAAIFSYTMHDALILGLVIAVIATIFKGILGCATIPIIGVYGHAALISCGSIGAALGAII